MDKYKIIETGDGSRSLFSVDFQQTFHSRHGALAECEQVYLQTSGVQRRLQTGQATQVLEIGFGTGLNFLATAVLAERHASPLHYVAMEKNPLPAEIFRQLQYDRIFPDRAELIERLATHFFSIEKGWVTEAQSIKPSENVALQLQIGDAVAAHLPDRQFQAVYLDAFSPDANPELWTADFFQKINQACVPDAVLATYSSKKSVQRALAAAGFAVEKVPGPWGKREILRAVVTKPGH